MELKELLRRRDWVIREKRRVQRSIRRYIAARVVPEWNESLTEYEDAQLYWSANALWLLVIRGPVQRMHTLQDGGWRLQSQVIMTKVQAIRNDGSIVGLDNTDWNVQYNHLYDTLLKWRNCEYHIIQPSRNIKPVSLQPVEQDNSHAMEHGNLYGIKQENSPEREHDNLHGIKQENSPGSEHDNLHTVKQHPREVLRVLLDDQGVCWIQDGRGLASQNEFVHIESTWRVLEIRTIETLLWLLVERDGGMAIHVYRNTECVYTKFVPLECFSVCKDAIFGFSAGRIVKLSIADLHEEVAFPLTKDTSVVRISAPYSRPIFISLQYSDGSLDIITDL